MDMQADIDYSIISSILQEMNPAIFLLVMMLQEKTSM